jgi:hypothetical protein
MARRVLVAAAVVLATVVTGCAGGDDSSPSTSSTTVPFVESTVATTSSTATSTRPSTTTSTTTTTLAGPPVLEVLDPAHGATVTTSRYTFTGVTDPGCTVTVGGKYEATVQEDGTWSLELVLEPGQNSTTFVAADHRTGLESSQAIRVYYAEAVELRGDGLGAVSFGQDETSTMAILTGLLGPPVNESTCIDDDDCTGMGYGWCTYIHTANWPDDELSIVIADCESPDEPPHTPTLIGWSVWSQTTLRTPEGVGPGSTLGELQAVYGNRLEVGYDGEYGGLHFAIDEPHGVGSGRLYGDLEHPPGFEPPDDVSDDPDPLLTLLDPSTKVTGFGAGVGQDTC